jgi:hypothetical protein
VGNVARLGQIRNEYTILVAEPEGNEPEYLDIDGRIILKRILGK